MCPNLCIFGLNGLISLFTFELNGLIGLEVSPSKFYRKHRTVKFVSNSTVSCLLKSGSEDLASILRQWR